MKAGKPQGMLLVVRGHECEESECLMAERSKSRIRVAMLSRESQVNIPRRKVCPISQVSIREIF